MLSNQQYHEATEFLKTYNDALKCVEQIAERRAAFEHYERSASDIATGVKNKEVELTESGVKPGENYQNFPLFKAQGFVEQLWKKAGFDSASSRDDLVQRLNKAEPAL